VSFEPEDVRDLNVEWVFPFRRERAKNPVSTVLFGGLDEDGRSSGTVGPKHSSVDANF